MKRCTSIYRDDYRWPETKSHFDRNDLSCEIAAPKVSTPSCISRFPDKPKTTQAKCPESEELTFDDTDACLKKLFRKNPELLKLMKKKPTLEGLTKFNIDRHTTTYQKDFDHKGNPPVDFDGFPPKRKLCPLDDYPPPVFDCRVNKKHPGVILRGQKGLDGHAKPCRGGRRGQSDDDPFQNKKKPIIIPPPKPPKPGKGYWTTEYSEEINRRGCFILKAMQKRKKNVNEISQERKKAAINYKTYLW